MQFFYFLIDIVYLKSLHYVLNHPNPALDAIFLYHILLLALRAHRCQHWVALALLVVLGWVVPAFLLLLVASGCVVFFFFLLPFVIVGCIPSSLLVALDWAALFLLLSFIIMGCTLPFLPPPHRVELDSTHPPPRRVGLGIFVFTLRLAGTRRCWVVGVFFDRVRAVGCCCGGHC